MKFLLDTNICVSIIRKKSASRIDWAMSHKPGDLAISVVTLCELEYGVSNSSDPVRNEVALMRFLAPIQIRDYTASIASIYGKIRVQLKHSTIGPMDMMIAAHALSFGVELATDNIKEFNKVPGIKIAKIP